MVMVRDRRAEIDENKANSGDRMDSAQRDWDVGGQIRGRRNGRRERECENEIQIFQITNENRFAVKQQSSGEFSYSSSKFI